MSKKVFIGNTIEQYAGLNLAAASSFSGKSIRRSGKAGNRCFSRFEQYAGLESLEGRKRAVQAAPGRGSVGPGSLKGSRVPGSRIRKAVIWLFPCVPAVPAGTVGGVG